ncbi:MAG: AAA family ATPase [Candidatus Thorarchaeota archaeon]
MKVIAITGQPGSGKTTALDAIKDLGIVVSMGDIIRNEAKKRNLVPSGINIGKIAKQMRKEEGPTIIAEKCVELIKNKKEEVIFIDGVRSLSEINVFKRYWKFPIIAIIVDKEIRFNRLFERGRSDDPKTLEELIERDAREIKFGLEEVLNNADYVIKNNSTIENLKQNLRQLVIEIIKNY